MDDSFANSPATNVSDHGKTGNTFAMLGLIIISFVLLLRLVIYEMDNYEIGFIGTDIYPLTIQVYDSLRSPIVFLAYLLPFIGIIFSILGFIGFKSRKSLKAKWLAIIGLAINCLYIILNLQAVLYLLFIR